MVLAQVPATELNDVAVKIVGSEVHVVPKSSSALFFGVTHLLMQLERHVEFSIPLGAPRVFFWCPKQF